jgi:hypothetical protein
MSLDDQSKTTRTSKIFPKGESYVDDEGAVAMIYDGEGKDDRVVKSKKVNTGEGTTRRSTKRRSMFHSYYDGFELENSIQAYNNSERLANMAKRLLPPSMIESLGFCTRLDLATQNLTNLIIKQQTKEHIEERIYSDIIRKDKKSFFNRLNELLDDGIQIESIRDTAGATLCHIAYVYESFEIARWLVTNYPELGLETYSSEFKVFGGERIHDCSMNMPYSNENILHITIVKRNHNETRWILDFYRDHKVSVPYGLEKLLTTFVSGTFFRRDGPFYFGGYPMHFAVCTNDVEMFDLVLSYASTISLSNTGENITTTPTLEFDGEESAKIDNNYIALDDVKKYRRLLGRNALFTRDQHGNTVLHLCVTHNLLDMYRHVKDTAKRLVRKELTNEFADYMEKLNEKDKVSIYKSSRTLAKAASSMPRDVHEAEAPYIQLEELIYEGNHPIPASGRSKVYLPTKLNSKAVDRTMSEEWLSNAIEDLLKDRLYLALNEDYHSPLTLAAMGNGKKGTKEEEESKKQTIGKNMWSLLLSSPSPKET